jgi:hypothetical protein
LVGPGLQVIHPLSIAECVELKGKDGITNIRFVDKPVGIEAFVRYNLWVTAVVPRERLFRFCPWDCR